MGLDPSALIDLSALCHNLQRVREAAPQSRIMAVIKADGYGHGMLRVARALQDADALAVARVNEGVRLREAGEGRPITVLEGFFDQADLEAAASHDLEPVIHEAGQITRLEQNPPANPVACWLKLDTGMHRLGMPPDTAAEAFRRLSDCAAVKGRVRLMTHLANADDTGDPATDRQLQLFRKLVQDLGTEACSANSGGLLGWKETHSEWVRPGIMLYGASPFLDHTGEDDGLLPVMTLRSRVIAVNRYRKGDRIGYGGSWSCPEDMPIGVVAIGYGDGYPRHAAAGTPVLINGRRVPLVGRVSMDSITVDLRTQPGVKVGDPVVLWGRGLPIEEIARAADTISYQLLCCITSRVEIIESEKDSAA
jgi:alanine racemase